jgi:hypothetical protein
MTVQDTGKMVWRTRKTGRGAFIHVGIHVWTCHRLAWPLAVRISADRICNLLPNMDAPVSQHVLTVHVTRTSCFALLRATGH